MSHLSAEVIINDFDKLKDMFSNMDENNIWEKFAANDFDFNKTLNSLLEKEKDKEDGDNYLKATTTSDNKLKRNKSFNVMETLGNIFNKNKSTSDSHDYQRLD